jgi:hypothetical protein
MKSAWITAIRKIFAMALMKHLQSFDSDEALNIYPGKSGTVIKKLGYLISNSLPAISSHLN